jgi:beta-phosphoglucomutase
MDGTIADTGKPHFRAWQVALEKYGVIYTVSDFISGFGRANKDLIPDLLGVEPTAAIVQQVSKEKEETFRRLAHEDGLKPLPGVLTWLELFREHGIQQVVSSSGPMANIAASVDILEIGDYFLSLMSGATLPRSKPDPAIFLNSAAAVNAEPQECIVVEDSMHGVEAARRSGMGCIAVGEVARNTEMNQVLAAAPEFACLRVDSMDQVKWEECEQLWARAVQR